MAAPILQFKRGNAGVAGTVPALRPGEPAISLNNFDFFIGIDTSVTNNKFFGSHRYWTREDGTNSLKLNLVDKGGTNKISIKSPDTLVGTGTYTLPDTNTIVDGYFLKVATDGSLSWSTAGGTNGTFTNPTLTGITTISGTQLNVNTQSNFTAIATFSNVDINDGTLDGVVIGQSSPDAGYFTLVDTDRLISDYSTIGFATATDFHIDSTRVLYNDGSGITLAGIQTIDATTKTTLETILAFDPNNFTTLNVTGIATVGGLIDGNGGLDITGHSELDNLNVSGVSTFSGLADFNGGTTIDNIQIGVTADNEIDTATGGLTLDSASGQTIIDDNLSVTGIATITGAFVANGNVTLGDAAGDTVTVKGTTTFEQSIVGTISTATNANNINITQTTSTDTTTSLVLVANQSTGFQTAFIDSGLTYNANTNNLTATTFTGSLTGTASTATRATLVDTTTAPTGTFYPGLFVNATGTASTAVYVDSGISYVSSTDTLTLTGDLAVNGGDLTSTSATFNLLNANATNINFAGAATALVMGASTGVATISNSTLTLPNATTVNINGANPTLASSSTGTLTAFNTNITKVNAFQAATDIVLGASTGITTVRNKLNVIGNLEVDGNQIQASDGNTNITLTSNTLTTFAGNIKVTGNNIQSSSATALTLSGADVTVAGNITVGGNDIKASNGTTALTLATTGAVTAANDLTVSGNLYVNGSTTQVNTTALTVEDRTIDLGIINGASPATATTWDLGVLFNYNSSGAKKSAVIWEHGDTRFKFASVLAADTDGTTVDTPQLTVSTFAPIEVAELWVNNTCTGGAQQVIGCVGAVLQLQNIVIDAGTFT